MLLTHRLPVQEEIWRVWLRGVDTVERGESVLGQEHFRPGQSGGVTRILDTEALHGHALMCGNGVSQHHGTKVVLLPHVRQPHVYRLRRAWPATLEIETFWSAPEVIIIESVILIFHVSSPPPCPSGTILSWSRTYRPLSILSYST